MPRTSHRVADDQAVGKRAMIVGAVCAHRKDVVAAPRQDDVVTVDSARNHSTIGKILK